MDTLCRIRDLYRAIADFEQQFTKHHGVSLNEGMLLCTLQGRPGQTSGELAEALGLSASNASKVIRSVEDKQFIPRILGSADRRQMQFALTPAGEKLIKSIKQTELELPDLLKKAVME